MMTAKEFLTDFLKDCVQHPMERQTLIDAYAEHMELREIKMIQDAFTAAGVEPEPAS